MPTLRTQGRGREERTDGLANRFGAANRATNPTLAPSRITAQIRTPLSPTSAVSHSCLLLGLRIHARSRLQPFRTGLGPLHWKLA